MNKYIYIAKIRSYAIAAALFVFVDSLIQFFSHKISIMETFCFILRVLAFFSILVDILRISLFPCAKQRYSPTDMISFLKEINKINELIEYYSSHGGDEEKKILKELKNAYKKLKKNINKIN